MAVVRLEGSMRIAVIADIHGNARALEVVRADIPGRRVDTVINLGDCVSGPLWPAETMAILAAENWPTVRGNHDRWVGDESYAPRGASDVFAHATLDDKQRAWLRDLPPRLSLPPGIIAFHAQPDSDTAYLIEDVANGGLVRAPATRIAERLGGDTARIVLCGHSHQPQMLQLPDGRWVINPGSVGCPAYSDPTEPDPHVSEAGSPAARYAVLSIEGDRVGVDMIALPYDHAAAGACADRNGRPDWGHALRTGFMAGQP
jgi:predicted phosphodiesterase